MQKRRGWSGSMFWWPPKERTPKPPPPPIFRELEPVKVVYCAKCGCHYTNRCEKHDPA